MSVALRPAAVLLWALLAVAAAHEMLLVDHPSDSVTWDYTQSSSVVGVSFLASIRDDSKLGRIVHGNDNAGRTWECALVAGTRIECSIPSLYGGEAVGATLSLGTVHALSFSLDVQSGFMAIYEGGSVVDAYYGSGSHANMNPLSVTAGGDGAGVAIAALRVFRDVNSGHNTFRDAYCVDEPTVLWEHTYDLLAPLQGALVERNGATPSGALATFIDVPFLTPAGRTCAQPIAEEPTERAEIVVSLNEQRVGAYVFAYVQLHTSYTGVSFAWAVDGGEVVSTSEILAIPTDSAGRNTVSVVISTASTSITRSVVLETYAATIDNLRFVFDASVTVPPSGVPMLVFVTADTDIGYGDFAWDFDNDGTADAHSNTPTITHDFLGASATVRCTLCIPSGCADTQVALGSAAGDVVLPRNAALAYDFVVDEGWVEGSTQFKVHITATPQGLSRFITLRGAQGDTTWCDLLISGAVRCGIRNHVNEDISYVSSGVLGAGTYDVTLAYTSGHVAMHVDGAEADTVSHTIPSVGGVEEIVTEVVSGVDFHIGEVRVWGSAHTDGSYVECAPHPHTDDLLFYAPGRYHDVNVKWMVAAASVTASPDSFDAFSDVTPCACSPTCGSECDGGLDGCGGRCPGDWWGCAAGTMCSGGVCGDPFCAADSTGCPDAYYCVDPAGGGAPGTCVAGTCAQYGCGAGWCDGVQCRQLVSVSPAWATRSAPLGAIAVDGVPVGTSVLLVAQGDGCYDASVASAVTTHVGVVDFGIGTIETSGMYRWCLSVGNTGVYEAHDDAPLLLVGDEEGIALYDLYIRNPAALSDWSFPATAAEMCAWSGVQCTGEDIVGVHLTVLDLGGPLPDFASLQLESVVMRSCGLTGTIPPALFHAGLETLDVRTNALTGSIPSEISVAALVSLDMRQNALGGPLPPVLPSTLVSVSLQDNAFTGPLPAAYGALSNLQYLDARINELSGELPTTLANWANVQTVHLARNDLTGDVRTFERLRTLQTLNLAGNRISGTLSQEWALNTALRVLQLDSNALTGTLPSLAALTDLTVFDVGDNRLSGTVPDMFGAMSSLSEVHLRKNLFVGPIPSSLVPLALAELRLAGNGWWCPDGGAVLPACTVSGCSTGDALTCHVVGDALTAHMDGRGVSQAMAVEHVGLAQPLQLWTDAAHGTFTGRDFTLASLSTYDSGDLVDPAGFDFGRYAFADVSFSVEADTGLPTPVFVRMHLPSARSPHLQYYDTVEGAWEFASAACTGAPGAINAPHEVVEADADTGGVVLVTKLCHLTQFAVLDEPAGEAVGDPHFRGLHGGWFDFTGTPGHTYCLISDARLQLNARMVHNAHGIAGTYMEEIGVVVGTSRVRFHRSGDVWVTPLERAHSSSPEDTLILDGGRGRVRIGERSVHIHAPPYDVVVTRYLGKGVEGDAARHVDAAHVGFSVNVDERAVGDAWDPHGVYGQTFVLEHVLVGRGPNGEGVVVGGPENYAVSGLFASDFAHSRLAVDNTTSGHEAAPGRPTRRIAEADGNAREFLVVDAWTGEVR